MDHKSDKTKHQLFTIFEIDNRIICLLCMKVICHDFHEDNSIRGLIIKNEILTSHFLDETHEMEVKSLFRTCFPGIDYESQNYNYADFVEGLVLDMSMYLGNVASYVSRIGSNVICCLCSESLYEVLTDEKSVDKVLFAHLKSNQHLINLRKWLCWVYFMEESNGFVIISHLRVYCSLCNKAIGANGSQTTFSLKVLFEHLENKHDLHLPRSREVSGNSESDETMHNYQESDSAFAVVENECVSNKDKSQSLEFLGNTKENIHIESKCDYICQCDEDQLKRSVMLDPYNVGSLENNYDHSSYLQTSSTDAKLQFDCSDSYSLASFEGTESNASLQCNARGSESVESGSNTNLISEDENDNYSDVTDSFKVLNLTDGNVKEYCSAEENSLDLLSGSSDFEEYDDASEALTCPDCGAFIEIVNDNAEFSLQLHCQKHKDLKNVNTEDELVFNANVDYICPVCHENIPIFNKNVELSVRHHFEERKVDHEGFGVADNNHAKPDLQSDIFSSLPEPLKKYVNFLIIEENNIFCKLCNCAVFMISAHDNISKVLHEHLNNSYHEEQYKSLSEDLALVVVDFSKQCQSYQPSQQLDPFKELIKKNPLIEKNKEFIERKSIHYFCKVCQKHINHSPQESTLVLNFMLHLRSSCHTIASKGVPPNTSENLRVQQLKTEIEAETQFKRKARTTLFWVSNRSAEVNINLGFIKTNVETRMFLCEICNESIEFTRTGSKLKSHCKSSAHNDTLTRHISKFVSKLSLSSEQKHHLGSLETVFDPLASCEFMKPHIQVVRRDKQGCRCILCDVVVSTNKKNIQQHIFGEKHKKRAFTAVKKIYLEKELAKRPRIRQKQNFWLKRRQKSQKNK